MTTPFLHLSIESLRRIWLRTELRHRYQYRQELLAKLLSPAETEAFMKSLKK